MLVIGQTFLPVWYYQGIEKIDRSVSAGGHFQTAYDPVCVCLDQRSF
jgi:hypothetical protein